MPRRGRTKTGVKISAAQKSTEMKPPSASPPAARNSSLAAVLRGKTPEPPRTPDFAFVKTILMAVLSQILFGRGCFQARNFQTISFDDLERYDTFHDVIESGGQVAVFERSRLLDRTSTLMFRRNKDAKFNKFLQTLTLALPLIDQKQLHKLRLPITSSKTWNDDCLVEYWTVYLNYRNDGVCCLDIWRGGTKQFDVGEDVTRSYLWQVGSYVAQLPALKRPFYMTQIFTSQARPDGLEEGWNYSAIDFDAAKLKLVQKEGYCFQKVASLYVTPREYDTGAIPPQLKVGAEMGIGPETTIKNKEYSPKTYNDFPSTDDLEESKATGDQPEHPLPTPSQHKQGQRGNFIQIEPPIETPPSDMEETQEFVPPASPDRPQKRNWRHGVKSNTVNVALPSSKYRRTESTTGRARRPAANGMKVQNTSTSGTEKIGAQESEQDKQETKDNQEKRRAAAAKRLDRYEGRLAKLRSEHEQTYMETSGKEAHESHKN